VTASINLLLKIFLQRLCRSLQALLRICELKKNLEVAGCKMRLW